MVSVLPRSLGTPHIPIRASGHRLQEAGCHVMVVVCRSLPTRSGGHRAQLPSLVASNQSVTVGVFTLWDLANATQQDIFLFSFSQRSLVKHLLVQHWKEE